MCVKYDGLTFSHGFRFDLDGKEYNIMITGERKESINRYVGICLDNGLISKSKERDFNIALSSIICDLVQTSYDVDSFYKKKFFDKNIIYLGAIDDERIRKIFDSIVANESSLSFYWELKAKIEYGLYLSESRYKDLDKSYFWLKFFTYIRMNVFKRPIKIREKLLSGAVLREKYNISRYITSIGEILSLSKLFQNTKWDKFYYAHLN